MYFTYILYSETISRYYTGSTQNIEERLRRHNSGHSKSTRGKGPWELIKSYAFETRAEAIQLEKRIKKRGARRFLEMDNK